MYSLFDVINIHALRHDLQILLKQTILVKILKTFINFWSIKNWSFRPKSAADIYVL